jgi:hypothetical protein
MQNYEPSLKTRVVDTEEGKQVLILLENPTAVKFTKEFTPEFDWYVEEVDLQTFFSIPLYYNLGLVMPFEKVDETEDEFVFMSYVVDPVFDVSMFRHSLKLD